MKEPKKTKSKEKTNTYQYIMRHIDIYGEPLSWFIGNNKTYNTTVGGCRTFIVISCTLLFLIYSIYNLFNDRNGSFIFYDITYPEIEDTTFYYYNDFEIFFFFHFYFYTSIISNYYSALIFFDKFILNLE